MQTDRGLVVSRHGDVVTVRLQPHAECASCSLSKFSLTQFCGGSKESSATVKATAAPGIAQGDLVEVSLDDSITLKAAVIVYGLPLVAFLVGVLGGYALSSLITLRGTLSTAAPVLAGFLMLVPGVVLSRKAARRLNPTATIVGKLDQEVTTCQ
ncbi:MAG TPA: SoxR reducing system RseC family protein [Clostridia bacterium]|nr:SoxR reducing system RseC family protein [Clostridia bacterium]